MTSRKSAILRPNNITPNDRGNGARTYPLVTRHVGSTAILNGITEFDPGARIAMHKHNCEESVMILEGEALLDLDGELHPMSVGDTTWLPPDVPHRFINASNESRMRILWIYASVDANRTMIESGETRSIDEEHKRAKSA